VIIFTRCRGVADGQAGSTKALKYAALRPGGGNGSRRPVDWPERSPCDPGRLVTIDGAAKASSAPATGESFSFREMPVRAELPGSKRFEQRQRARADRRSLTG